MKAEINQKKREAKKPPSFKDKKQHPDYYGYYDSWDEVNHPKMFRDACSIC